MVVPTVKRTIAIHCRFDNFLLKNSLKRQTENVSQSRTITIRKNKYGEPNSNFLAQIIHAIENGINASVDTNK